MDTSEITTAKTTVTSNEASVEAVLTAISPDMAITGDYEQRRKDALATGYLENSFYTEMGGYYIR